MNFSQLEKIIATPESVLSFCQENRLVSKEKRCWKCNNKCTLKKEKSGSDSFAWVCRSGQCRKRTSMRRGTFFERSHLSIGTIIRFIYMWAYEMATHKILRRECGIMSDHTLSGWKNFMRDICQKYLLRNPEQMGGTGPTGGHTVEIDKPVFNKRKHNGGKQRNKKECRSGTKRELKDNYSVEVLWRQKFGKDPFASIITHIATCYPVGAEKQLSPQSSTSSQANLSPTLLTPAASHQPEKPTIS